MTKQPPPDPIIVKREKVIVALRRSYKLTRQQAIHMLDNLIEDARKGD